MTAVLLAAAVVVLIPGLAVLEWARSMPSSRGFDRLISLPERVSLVYAGIGIACIALWLGATRFGLSPWTSAGAPLTASAIIWLSSRVRVSGRADRPEPPAVGVYAPDMDSPRRTTAFLCALGFASVFLVALPFSPYGWERADGIHRMAMTDWEKHLRMAVTILGSTVFPPPHPYIHVDAQPSYYFGYHLVAAAIASIGGRSADVFASLWLLTLVTAGATPFVVYMFSRDSCSTARALWAAAASTLLVGFDAVPLVLESMRAAAAHWPLPRGFAGVRAIVPSTHIDFWIHNVDRQFSAPVVATMWAPHQTTAALLCLIVLYLLAPPPGIRHRTRGGWLVPAILIAALAGLSLYMALGLATGVASAAIVEAIRDRQAIWSTATVRRWWRPGTIGVLLALPIVPVVTRGSSSGLIFYVSLAGTWTNGAIFSALFGAHQWTNLLDTPAVFLIDFGVIGVLGLLHIVRLYRADELTPVQQQAAAVAIAIMVLVTFVRPPLGIGNNLYARTPLLWWFLLAPFAAMAAVHVRRAKWLAAAVLICSIGTAYAEVGYLLEGGLFWATPKPTVAALRWINDFTARLALVAIRPVDYESNVGYWLRRPVVLGSRRLALLFGANREQDHCTSLALDAAFAETDPEAARTAFDRLEADVILVRRAADGPRWATAPCFDVTYRNSEWTVVVRTRTACPAVANPNEVRTAVTRQDNAHSAGH